MARLEQLRRTAEDVRTRSFRRDMGNIQLEEIEAARSIILIDRDNPRFPPGPVVDRTSGAIDMLALATATNVPDKYGLILARNIVPKVGYLPKDATPRVDDEEGTQTFMYLHSLALIAQKNLDRGGRLLANVEMDFEGSVTTTGVIVKTLTADHPSLSVEVGKKKTYAGGPFKKLFTIIRNPDQRGPDQTYGLAA